MADSIWGLDEIRECIEDGDTNLSLYRSRMEIWERMYNLDAYSEEMQALAREQKRALDVDSFPKAVCRLAKDLIFYEPMVTVGCRGPEDIEQAKARKLFLTHIWKKQAEIQDAPPLADMAHSAIVFGWAAAKVIWLGIHARWPIKILAIRPDQCWVEMGDDGKSWAYHRYSEKVRNLKLRYPDYDWSDRDVKDEVEVVDFWWVERIGKRKPKIYEAVLLSQDYHSAEFLLEPTHQKKYYDIPIYKRASDVDFSEKHHNRGNPIHGGLGYAWSRMNRVRSTQIEAIDQHFWPTVFIETSYAGQSQKSIKIKSGPGQYNSLPPGSKVVVPNIQPNMRLLQDLEGGSLVEYQRMTFSDPLFGVQGQSGGPQAGYAQQMLQQQTYGRMNGVISCLTSMLREINTICLCFVDKFVPDELELWGFNAELDQSIDATIRPEDINGFYANDVKVSLKVAGEIFQMILTSMQQVDRGIMSKETFRTKFAHLGYSDSEQEKIHYEQALEDPDIKRQLTQALFDQMGIALPPNEPNFADDEGPLHQAIAEAQAQLVAQSLQPQQVVPDLQGAPPQVQGQILPGDIGIPQQGGAVDFAAATGRELSVEELQALEAGQGSLR